MIAYIIGIILFFVNEIDCEIPSYIHVCKRSDPELSSCITNSIETLKPYLKDGISELDVPPLEPLYLKNLQLNVGSGGQKIVTNLSDIQVRGASDFAIQDLRADVDINTFQYVVNVPKIYLDALYETDSKLLFLHIKGKGDININITDYRFDCTMKGNKIEKDGETYLEFEPMDCEATFRDLKIHLGNLFNGNKMLGNVTNNALNDHIGLFYEEIKPNLRRTLSQLFTNVANKITLRFSYEELFP